MRRSNYTDSRNLSNITESNQSADIFVRIDYIPIKLSKFFKSSLLLSAYRETVDQQRNRLVSQGMIETVVVVLRRVSLGANHSPDVNQALGIN